jgi:beta-galactosidase
LSRSFSADPATDKLWLEADHSHISRDGSDASRLAFGVVDKFGAPRLFGQGSVTFSIEGPGFVVGDNPFDLTESGGMGAVWIKAEHGISGRIRVHAKTFKIGSSFVELLAR